MITLAVASAFQTLASQLSDFTGGEDGLTFKLPELICAELRVRRGALPRRLARRPAARATTCCSWSRWCCCWRCCASSTRPSAACCRRSARTSSAPRRSATAWWCTARLSQRAVGAVRHAGRRDARDLAALQRARHLAELRDHARRAADRRDRRHGHDLRRGHRRGALRGRAELPAGPAASSAASAADGVPWLSALLSPDRWLLWLGVLFVLSVYYFPTGIVGRLRARARASDDMTPTSHYLQLRRPRDPLHRVGRAATAAVVIAWHGLARTGRDMDDSPRTWRTRFRVICPDTIGRGLSQWSPAPDDEYCLAFYAQLAAALCRPARARRACTGSAPRWAARSALLRGGRRRCAGAHREPGAQRHRAAAGRGGDRAHPHLRRQPAGLRHGGASSRPTSAPSTSPTAGSATRSGGG